MWKKERARQGGRIQRSSELKRLVHTIHNEAALLLHAAQRQAFSRPADDALHVPEKILNLLRLLSYYMCSHLRAGLVLPHVHLKRISIKSHRPEFNPELLYKLLCIPMPQPSCRMTSATSKERGSACCSTPGPGTHFLNAALKSAGGSPKTTSQEGSSARSCTEGNRTASSCAMCREVTNSTAFEEEEAPGRLHQRLAISTHAETVTYT